MILEDIKSCWKIGTDCYRKYNYVDELINNEAPDKILGLRIISVPCYRDGLSCYSEYHFKIAEYKNLKNEWIPIYESMALYTSTCIERARQILGLRMTPNIKAEIDIAKDQESKWWEENN